MSTFEKRILSGSTDGRGIAVIATATLGTTIHTAVTGTSDLDEVWLYATNSDTVDRDLTIEWGGVTVPDDVIDAMTISPNSGLVLVVPGWLLQNAKVITAFASVTDVISINGFVNRITA